MNQIGRTPKESYNDTIKKIFLDPLKKIKGISEEIVELFQWMMRYDPKARCSSDQALGIIRKYAPNVSFFYFSENYSFLLPQRKIIISEKETLLQEKKNLEKTISVFEKLVQ